MNAGTIGKPAKARLPRWRRLGWRLGASFLLLTALGIFLSGLLQYRAQQQWLRQSLGSLLLNIARTGALLVDGDLHERVVKDGRNDTPAYEEIQANLQQIKEKNELGDPVYTLSDVEGKMARFAVISHGEESVGKQYQLAKDIRPILRRVFTEGTAAFTDIYTNQHGTWITAFAPIRNTAGQTVAALDVDFRAHVYLQQLEEVWRRFLLHSLAGAALALVAGLLLARQITRPVAQLSTMAQRVVEGDLTTPEHIKSQTEIGLLGNVLHLMVERVHVSHRNVVDVLVRVLQAQGRETGSLSQLAGAALALADHLELSPSQREALELGALLHDIGEIRVPDAVLEKAGPLTPEERGLVQQHPAWGAEILETVPVLTPALDVVGAHHERYDGSGYPQGLRGEDIPLTARIFAVVDALDAMTHDRPYRRARPVPEALEELRQVSGKQFDPRVVDAALKIPSERWEELLLRQARTIDSEQTG
ncbi:MAG: HD domain-containing phosphohydrolase [Nitrospirales bacterium]